jgi:hypothetical protein
VRPCCNDQSLITVYGNKCRCLEYHEKCISGLHCVEKYGIFIVESEHVITVEVCRTGFFEQEIYSQRKALFFKFRTEFYKKH